MEEDHLINVTDHIAHTHDQGYKPKRGTTLDHYCLKPVAKQEPIIPSYNETPNLGFSLDSALVNKTMHKNRTNIGLSPFTIQPIPKSKAPRKSKNGGMFIKVSAKARLYEICAVNYWKVPVFECVKEEGPSHLRLFTFKVTIDIAEDSRTFLECLGGPRATKKAAEEHSAEGALWYLHQEGYVQ